MREPGFAGATPQDLLRDFLKSPKGVLLRYGEANGVVERVEPRQPTAGGKYRTTKIGKKTTSRKE